MISRRWWHATDYPSSGHPVPGELVYTPSGRSGTLVGWSPLGIATGTPGAVVRTETGDTVCDSVRRPDASELARHPTHPGVRPAAPGGSGGAVACVYVDMDGVLVDAVGGVLDMWDIPAHLSTQVSAIRDLGSVVSRHNPWGTRVSHETVWATAAAAGEGWWANLRPTPWLGLLLGVLEGSGVPWCVLSTTISPGCSAGKHAWCDRWLPEDTRVALSGVTRDGSARGCKHHMAHPGALLVDDDPGNVERFRAHGGQALLWPAPWNGHPEPDAYHGALRALQEVLGATDL